MKICSSSLSQIRAWGVSADDLDFETCYSFSHSLNSSRKLTRDRATADKYLWHVKFEDQHGEDILESDLSRTLTIGNLHSERRKGLVAYNALFILKPSRRRNGFAKCVYAAESELYRKWQVKEVHISAREDGLHVWIKKFGFRPVPAVERAMRSEYHAWATRKNRTVLSISKASDYPDEFLVDRGELDLFKVLEP